MKKWLQQWLFITPGVFLAAWAVEGIGASDWRALVLVAAVLGAFNLVLKPLLILFALPFVILTLGIGVIVINALLLLLAGELVPGFEIMSFWSAFWGGLIISIVSGLAAALFGDRKIRVTGRVHGRSAGNAYPSGRRSRRKDHDVIDV